LSEAVDSELEEGWEAATPEFAQLEQFLVREHQAQNASHEAVYDLSVEERVSTGRALEGVKYLRTEGEKNKAVHVFSCPKNISRFRPGTRLRVSRQDPRRPVAQLELVEDRFDGKNYILKLGGTIEDPKCLEIDETWVLDEDIFDLLDTQMSILHAAQESDLGEWLGGIEEKRPDGTLPEGAAFAEGLQANMLTAFNKAVAARPYFAVQGPPGSGKTHLLARLALYYALEENKRVLVTAVSHQAIHHALGETYFVGRRMVKAHPKAKEFLDEGFYKLGASRGRNEGLPDGVRPVFRISPTKRPMIAGATLYAALNPAWGFSKQPFDVILFDEAGQAPIILALAARLLSRKTIFIGDDAQLPPVVNMPFDEDVGDLGRLSALQFIRRDYEDPFLLTETRRLNEQLCSTVSDCFYDGALLPTKEAARRRLVLREKPAPKYEEILRADEGLIFVDVPHENAKSVSEGEAVWAASIAAEAVRCGVPPQEVGIIAPYRAQGNRIRFLLGKRSRVVCSTVERFQGQEREVVVLSLTSSHIRYLARLAGFVFDPHRLNVAISRARTKVIILGSRKALVSAIESGETSDPDAPFARGFEVFRRILDAAHLVDGGAIPRVMPSEAGLVPDQPPAEVSGMAFEAGLTVDHPLYGVGHVISKSTRLIDNEVQWVNEMRFADGKIRLIVPALSVPPIKEVAD
jgi:DNA replication ATP-dependent helicase Dna2